ncbi:hypothetical protein GUITHDRAFT_146675 [Guillardia theta CCMP2712]|uniref:Uncharacterized protein n=1 Tax=Guillardia theta (strain CCMP2712) TaxID=905079 RepID=L1IG00_GUITC|nr:hypothetical protein GUITHDRAFT_146675 [Guillardia theta CCMP2712]EKX35173.1 hypothetical protein GUITHDRAFT_146675 [Guillardia theta CCMP2712]|eukprot:XP_005822153.1 hypothetical protein GUITHDRAFT_146675 [Guillardia theta CCMP2712]
MSNSVTSSNSDSSRQDSSYSSHRRSRGPTKADQYFFVELSKAIGPAKCRDVLDVHEGWDCSNEMESPSSYQSSVPPHITLENLTDSSLAFGPEDCIWLKILDFCMLIFNSIMGWFRFLGRQLVWKRVSSEPSKNEAVQMPKNPHIARRRTSSIYGRLLQSIGSENYGLLYTDAAHLVMKES